MWIGDVVDIVHPALPSTGGKKVCAAWLTPSPVTRAWQILLCLSNSFSAGDGGDQSRLVEASLGASGE